MPYCPRCGVEVDAHAQLCPLCKTEIPKLADLTWTEPAWPTASDHDPSQAFPSRSEKKARIFLFLTTLLVIPTLVMMAMDYFQDQALSWSLVPVVSLGAAFVYLLLAFYQYNAFLRITLGYLATTALYLFTLEKLLSYAPWFLTLGLPILLALAIALVSAYFLILRSHRKGFNVFGIVLLAITGFCLALDCLIHIYVFQKFLIGWSLLVALVGIPIALYLFFLHYGLKRDLNLKRTFHI